VVVRPRSAQLVEELEVLLDGVGHAVEELVLVDRAVRAALTGGTVVGDHDHDRVVELAGLLQVVKQPPHLVVGVAQEAGVHLRHPREQALLVGGLFNHSMNYRSAMVFGVARLVTEPAEQLLALRTITEHLVPGQWSYARQPTKKELAATSALALPLTEASVKIRAGGPSDEPEDYELDIWAGVAPVTTGFGVPEPDPVLRPGIETPPHILKRG
jgi:hypothetical protein